MIWYEAFLGGIKPIKVERTTEKHIFLPNGSRRAIDSGVCWYRPTVEEAKGMMVNQYRKNVEMAKRRLVGYLARLEAAERATCVEVRK